MSRFYRTQTSRDCAFEHINEANFQTATAIGLFDCAKEFEKNGAVYNICVRDARKALQKARKHLEYAKCQRMFGYKYCDIPG